MKYQNLKSFQKHLCSAAPHNLCRMYLISISDDFERAKALDAVLAYFVMAPTRFSGAQCDLKDVIDSMQSLSLLGDDPVVVLDEVEKLSKKQTQQLCDQLISPSGYIFMGSRSKVSSLSEIVEKQGVILDLLGEKPWDKEKRLIEQLSERVKNAGKRLCPEGPTLLLERLGSDSALLESEIDKLICYVGDRPMITREDILSISPASRSATLWQTAEDVIWERGEFPSVDGTAFHGLIPALRNQLHLGLTLATLIEERCPSDQWSKYLPKLWPKTLEKRSSQAARLGIPYFQNGLVKLLEIELLSRTNSTQYRALLDLFRTQIYAR